MMHYQMFSFWLLPMDIPFCFQDFFIAARRDNPRFGRWTNVEMDTNHSPKRRMRVVNSGEWMVNNG